MSIQMKSTGITLATAAAALFVAGAVATMAPGSAQAADVKCTGINACKGQSACKSPKNECKGHNACKGQGWMPTATEADCTKAGGTVAK